MPLILTQVLKGSCIGLVTGLIAAFGGPHIETKHDDKSLQGLLMLWKHSAWQAIILTILAGPLAEELIFRFAGISILNYIFPHVLSITLTSILFGLAHNQYPLNLISGVLGAILGVIYIKWGLSASIGAHAVHNAVVIFHLGWRFRRITGQGLTEALGQLSVEEAYKQYTNL